MSENTEDKKLDKEAAAKLAEEKLAAVERELAANRDRQRPKGRFSRKDKLELIALVFLLLFGWFFISTIRGMSKKLDDAAMEGSLSSAPAVCEALCEDLWTI